MRKLLALSEPNKTRPHQPRQAPIPIGIGTNQPSPAVRRAPSATGNQYKRKYSLAFFDHLTNNKNYIILKLILFLVYSRVFCKYLFTDLFLFLSIFSLVL